MAIRLICTKCCQTIDKCLCPSPRFIMDFPKEEETSTSASTVEPTQIMVQPNQIDNIHEFNFNISVAIGVDFLHKAVCPEDIIMRSQFVQQVQNEVDRFVKYLQDKYHNKII